VRKSAADFGCHTLAATECVHADGYAVNWTAGNARAAVGTTKANRTCAALDATNCRDTTGIKKAFTASVKTGRKSATDGACADVAAGQCKNAGIITKSILFGRKAAADYDCAAIDATKCSKDEVTTAMTGTMSWTSATDSKCNATGLTATHKLCPTGVSSGKTTNADADCFVKTTGCKAATGSATLGYLRLWKDANTSTWKGAADAACTALTAGNCRDSATGLAAAMGTTKTWTSATDGTCKALASGSCRCKAGTANANAAVVGTATTAPDCDNKNFECDNAKALAASHCRKAKGTTYAYKGASDFTCVALKSTQCTCADGTAGTGARKTATPAVTTCATACPVPAAPSTAAAGEGEAGEGEGEHVHAATKKASGAIVALFFMLLSMF